MIIIEKAKYEIEVAMQDKQAGFRGERSTQGWVFVMREISQKAVATKNDKMVKCIVKSISQNTKCNECRK